MLMFMAILSMSLLATLVCVAAFGLATRAEDQPHVRPEPTLAVDPPRFFAAPRVRPVEAPQVPIEALLSQIERHVRMEKAAAEAFLEVPTPDTLHSRTASPLLN
jgi:hypothetical protein